MSKINELIARWNTDEGKPYKGSLIDIDSYKDGNLSCMCAQGQVLHIVGGWDAGKLDSTDQEDADKATAKLLNISRAHAVLLRNTNDKIDGAPAIVLTDPAKVIGDQWSKLLDYWWHMDRMSADDWKKLSAAARAEGYAEGYAAGDAAMRAAWDAATWAAWAAMRAAMRAARDAATWAATWAAWNVARDAANEIQGAEILKSNGTPFFFLPMFGFATPDDIPARPADYGVAA